MDQLKSVLPEGLGIGKIHHVAVIVRDMEARRSACTATSSVFRSTP